MLCSSCSQKNDMRKCWQCDSSKSVTEFTSKRWGHGSTERICMECTGDKQCSSCQFPRRRTHYTKEQWNKPSQDRLCLECTPKACAGHCKQLLKRDGYHGEQWKLPEGVAVCYQCHTKRCFKCSTLKRQDAFPSNVIWRMQDSSPEFLCSLCAQGPRRVGQWTCAAKRCSQQKPVAEFSIVIERAKAKGQDTVPRGSKRCNACIYQFDADLRSQAQVSQSQVQQKRKP